MPREGVAAESILGALRGSLSSVGRAHRCESRELLSFVGADEFAFTEDVTLHCLQQPFGGDSSLSSSLLMVHDANGLT